MSTATNHRTNMLTDLALGALALALVAWTISSMTSAAAHGQQGASNSSMNSADQSVLVLEASPEHILAIIDQRTEELLIYRPKGTTSLELRSNVKLPTLFSESRQSGLNQSGGPGQVPNRAPSSAAGGTGGAKNGESGSSSNPPR